jgi:hypothetical protein
MTRNIDWMFVIIMMLMAIIFFAQAYTNLVRGRNSSFGIDALNAWLYRKKVRGTNNKKVVRAMIEQPERLKRMGINALLFGVGFVGGSLYYVNYVLQNK